MDNNYLKTINYFKQTKEEYYVVFSLNNIKYAINIQNVIEIINIPRLEMPEKMPCGIIGMFNYNNNIIKAIDLSVFLEVPSTDFSIKGKMLVLSVNNNFFAVYSNDIETVVKFNVEDIQEIPYLSKNSILKNLYKIDNANISIIDCSVLLELIQEKQSKKSDIDYSKFFKTIENVKQKSDLEIKNSFAFPIDIQNSKQYILFELNNKYFYLDIKHVKEFVSMKRLNLTKLPYTEDYILGIVRIKGVFLIVVNLKKFLDNTDNSPIIEDKLIIVDCKNFNIAFLVDDIKYIKNLDNVKKFKVSSKYIYAEFYENDILYSILDFDEIINDNRFYINIE